jgi:MFS family permease
MHPRRRQRFSPAFRSLWFADSFSNLADGVQLAMLPLLAAQLTRSPEHIGGLAFVLAAPWLLLSLPAGVLVDKAPRVFLMRTVAVVRVAISIAVLVTLFEDRLGLPALYVAAFLLGACETVYDNASQSLVPVLVGDAHLDAANARIQSTELVAGQFAGPSLGSALFTISAPLTFGLNALLFSLSAFLMGRVPPVAGKGGHEDASAWRSLREGVAWLLCSRPLRLLAIASACFFFFSGAWFGILVLYVVDVLDLSVVTFGAVLAIGALGAVLGSLAAGPVRRRFGVRRVLCAAVAAAAVAQLVMGVTSFWAVAFASLFAAELAGAVWNVIVVSLRQSLAPDELRGRVNSAFRLASAGALALGSLGGGFLAGQAGVRAPFIAGAPVLMLVAVALALGLRGLETSGDDEPAPDAVADTTTG